MFCSNCGKQIPDVSGFCPYCGLKLGGKTEITKEEKNQTVQANQKDAKEQKARGEKKKIKSNGLVKWIIVASTVVVICTSILIGLYIITADRSADGDGKTDTKDTRDVTEYEQSVLTNTDKEGKNEKPEKPEEAESENAKGLYDSYDFSGSNVGDVICLGSYEQDRQPDGADPIEWLILSKGSDRLLVLSKFALDCQPYNSEYVDVTWENCSLRKWLNEQFYSEAFNQTEKSMIRSIKLINRDNSESGTLGGNDTIDRVFILSVEDVSKAEYGFDPDLAAYDENRRCSPTEYAVSQGAYQYFGTGSTYITSEGEGAGFWWLRSPGKSGDYAASVNSRGYVRDYGDSVRVGANAVRPAMWIKIKSE